MIVGIGTDALDVDRMRRELRRPGGGLVEEVFTRVEIAYCRTKRYPARHFAARFAAKEALLKALGTGAPDPSAFRDVEVVDGGGGRPCLVLRGAVRRLAEARCVRNTWLSLSHTATVASAFVVLET